MAAGSEPDDSSNQSTVFRTPVGHAPEPRSSNPSHRDRLTTSKLSRVVGRSHCRLRGVLGAQWARALSLSLLNLECSYCVFPEVHLKDYVISFRLLTTQLF